MTGACKVQYVFAQIVCVGGEGGGGGGRGGIQEGVVPAILLEVEDSS